MLNSTMLLLLITALLLLPPQTSAHGLLSTPRSRNYVAYTDRIFYHPQTENDPFPEDCPSCLNRDGVLGECGVINGRNYDLPKNALGGV